MLPGSNYELFTPTQTPTGSWEAFVHPEYYGMLMFAQAFPPGARFLPVSAPSSPLKLFATTAPDGHIRVELINKDTSNDYLVQIQVPGASSASLEYLQAPAVNSTSGVTLGGQTFGTRTTSGTTPPLSTLLVPLGLASFRDGITWSPYYAISLVKDRTHPGVYRVLVVGQFQSAGEYVEVVPLQKVVFTFGL